MWRWEVERRRLLCDNAHVKRHVTSVVTPSCYDNLAEYVCEVTYNEVDSDTVYLCAECRERLRREVRRNGYRFRSRRIVK